MSLMKLCLNCKVFFMLSTCDKCNKDNSILVHAVRINDKKWEVEDARIQEVRDKIRFWEGKKNQAQNYINKNKEKLEQVKKKFPFKEVIEF